MAVGFGPYVQILPPFMKAVHMQVDAIVTCPQSADDVHKVLTTTSFSPSSCTPGRCGRCLGYFSGAQENTLVSREQCACICHSKGFTMAGVENGNNCYCKPFLFYFPATPPPCLLTMPAYGVAAQHCSREATLAWSFFP